MVYLLLVAAIVVGVQLGTSRDLSGAVGRLEGAESELRAYAAAQQGRAVTTLDEGRRGSIVEIDRRIAEIDAQLAQDSATPADPLKLMSAPQDAIVGHVRRQMDRELLGQERGFLVALRTNLQQRGEGLSLDAQIAARTASLQALDQAHARGEQRLAFLATEPVWRRYALQDGRILYLVADAQAEQAANRRQRAVLATQLQALQEARSRWRAAAALATPEVAVAPLEALAAPVSQELDRRRTELRATLGGEARWWYERLGVGKALVPALIALCGVILMPLIIRTVFYWVLAPMAASRPAIRLQEGETPAPVPADVSAPSKSILLAPGEELLVKQGYLQSAPRSAQAATKLLLDWRHPLASLVSGLFFVTRLRGAGTDPATVSALHSPFSEVGILDLPAGTACVLRPRAIAAVIQPVGQPLRIVSRWRLFHLNAWLAGQLRFLVLHGPARIVVKGDRGVRFEAAGEGRAVGQDQLVGFSARLAYSAIRTETFLPYLFGMTGLFKDQVASGEGVLVIEEAPLAGRRSGGVKHGLEGLADALLKVFGI